MAVSQNLLSGSSSPFRPTERPRATVVRPAGVLDKGDAFPLPGKSRVGEVRRAHVEHPPAGNSSRAPRAGIRTTAILPPSDPDPPQSRPRRDLAGRAAQRPWASTRGISPCPPDLGSPNDRHSPARKFDSMPCPTPMPSTPDYPTVSSRARAAHPPTPRCRRLSGRRARISRDESTRAEKSNGEKAGDAGAPGEPSGEAGAASARSPPGCEDPAAPRARARRATLRDSER